MCNNVASIGVLFFDIDTTKGPYKELKKKKHFTIRMLTYLSHINMYTIPDIFVDYVSNILV